MLKIRQGDAGSGAVSRSPPPAGAAGGKVGALVAPHLGRYRWDEEEEEEGQRQPWSQAGTAAGFWHLCPLLPLPVLEWQPPKGFS